LLAGVGPLVPRLRKIWTDGAYSGEELTKWCEEQGGWELNAVERDKQAKDYERKVQTSETLIEVAMIRLILRRLGGAA
jgi:putative transposase